MRDAFFLNQRSEEATKADLPVAQDLEDTLKANREHCVGMAANMIGGRIEEYMPWEEEVAIICNEEGKMMGLPLNRGIKDEKGHFT